jgi:hypothetical protein
LLYILLLSPVLEKVAKGGERLLSIQSFSIKNNYVLNELLSSLSRKNMATPVFPETYIFKMLSSKLYFDR